MINQVYSFQIEGRPPAWSTPISSGPGRRYHQRKDYEAAMDVLVYELIRQRPPAAPFGPDKAIWLMLTVWFPIAPSWKQWRREAAEREILAPTKKPDLTNFVKAIEDGLVRAKWLTDDAQVVGQVNNKVYGACWRFGVEVAVFDQPQTRADYARLEGAAVARKEGEDG